jgi:hypothetical protein
LQTLLAEDNAANQQRMVVPEHFKLTGDHAEYRPTGQVSPGECVTLIASAIAFAREQQARKLLIVTLGLKNNERLTIAARYEMMQEWAKAAKGLVKVAIVTRPRMIDPQKFEVTVAANSGLNLDVFTTEDEALAWLRQSV